MHAILLRCGVLGEARRIVLEVIDEPPLVVVAHIRLLGDQCLKLVDGGRGRVLALMPEHSRIAHLVGVELIELRSGQMDEAGLHEVGQQGRVVARQCAAAYIALELLVELRSEDGEDVDVLRHLMCGMILSVSTLPPISV